MNEVRPLRRWRKDNGVTLTDLAGQVHVKPSHLSMVERGKRRSSPALVRRLSDATGLPTRILAPELTELLSDEPSEAVG